MKRLPIGDQSLPELLKSGALYIDKTEEIYKLLQPRSRYFLSRPRRFGKSLTCSTLEAIFEGKKEVFKDLWIGQSDYAWEKHPVVRFDFSRISHQTRDDLVKGLHSALDATAKKYDIRLGEEQLSEKLAALITWLAEKQGPVAVIIEEYDKPILDLIDKPEEAECSRNELRSFYGTLKGDTVDNVLHFLFVTGVSKFAKVSFFSELNNLNDITLDEQFAAIVGYTQQDVETYLMEHIKVLAEKEQRTYEQTLGKLKTWYNGFRFSESEVTVYNPFSLHRCLVARKFSNYWFSSGTPSFLMKLISKDPVAVKNFVDQGKWEIAASDMESFSIEVYYRKIITLFLQTGYLTIKSYDDVEENFTLDYPNYEVRSSMARQIMEYVAHIPSVKFGKFYKRFINALEQDNIDEYCSAFRDYLKLIPHDIIADRENFFQATFLGTAALMDEQSIRSEVCTDRGYVDIVMHGAKKVYVMEFKKDKTPENAMNQILEKKYYEKYVIEGKINGRPVVLVGINFDLGPEVKKGKTGKVAKREKIENVGVEVAWVIKELL